MEILVADATSGRDVSARLSTLQNDRTNLQIIASPARTIPSGLNATLRAASGEYIVRVDASAIIEPDFVRQCVENLRNTGTDNVTGKMAVARTGFFATSLSAATKSRFGIGGGMFPYYNEETRLFSFCGEEPRVDAVYLSAWRRDLFAQIGLFDEGLGRNQDDSINCRLLENRGRVMLSSEIKSTFETRTTLGSILRNYFEYGMWKVRFMQRHPWHITKRQFASPVLVGMWLLLAVVATASSVGMTLFAGLTGLLVTVNFAASLLTARRCGLKQLPKLCLTFAAMHFGYGLGVLSGLVRFAGRWKDRGQYEKLATVTAVAEQVSSQAHAAAV